MLPDEETTPQTAEEVTPQTETEPTGQEVEAPIGEREPTPQEPESPELTPERIAELQGFEQRYKEIESYKTTLEQERAEQRETLQRQQEALRILGGQVQQQQDPLAAARAELEQAYTTFDGPTIAAANEKYLQIHGQRVAQQAVQQATQQTNLQQQLQEAKRWGDFSPDQLAQTGQTLTADELAMVARARKGDLLDVLNSDVEKRKAEADRAQRLNTMFGEGTEGTLPGSLEENTVPTIEWANFVTELTKEQQKELVEKGVRILNAPGSE